MMVLLLCCCTLFLRTVDRTTAHTICLVDVLYRYIYMGAKRVNIQGAKDETKVTMAIAASATRRSPDCPGRSVVERMVTLASELQCKRMHDKRAV